MRAFDYTRAASLDDAVGAANADTRFLAGGTDLLTLMKADLIAPRRLIDIRQAGIGDTIEETDAGLVIGALATLDDLARHPVVRERYTALAEAAALSASPQLRNMATIGGNILQRPRCWYFRHPQVRCWLKGGADCPAREGENRQHALFGAGPCYAVHASDPANALLAFDAEVVIHGRGSVPLADLFALPSESRRRETTIAEDDLIVSLRLPAQAGAGEGIRSGSGYLKAMDRAFWSFALVGVAVVMRQSAGRIRDARIVLGGVAPIPWRARAAERRLIDAVADKRLFEAAAAAALEGVRPLAQNGYKVPLLETLIRRALIRVAEGD